MKKEHWARIIIENFDETAFFQILEEYYAKDKSSDDSVFVHKDYELLGGEEKPKMVEAYNSFSIIFEPEGIDFFDIKELANISYSEIANHLVVVIAGQETNSEEWNKVRSITNSILTTIKELKGKILSIDPADFLQKDLLAKDVSKEEQLDNHDSKPKKIQEPWETDPNLSIREKEIIQLDRDGLTSKQIGEKLILKLEVVENYKTIIRNKCGSKILLKKGEKKRI